MGFGEITADKFYNKNKLHGCCEMGTYKCGIGSNDIDACIFDLVNALNRVNIKTISSCCGHGKMDGIISLGDGRELTIKFKKALGRWIEL